MKERRDEGFFFFSSPFFSLFFFSSIFLVKTHLGLHHFLLKLNIPTQPKFKLRLGWALGRCFYPSGWACIGLLTHPIWLSCSLVFMCRYFPLVCDMFSSRIFKVEKQFIHLSTSICYWFLYHVSSIISIIMSHCPEIFDNWKIEKPKTLTLLSVIKHSWVPRYIWLYYLCLFSSWYIFPYMF